MVTDLEQVGQLFLYFDVRKLEFAKLRTTKVLDFLCYELNILYPMRFYLHSSKLMQHVNHDEESQIVTVSLESHCI